jgi:hypothetical protein
MQKKTGYSVLIIGGGRWGQITYNNLIYLKNINCLTIISRSLNLKNSIIKKDIERKKNLIIKEAKKFDLLIICKDNNSKLRYLKNVMNLKSIIVIEKPLIIKNNFQIFFNKIKKKIYI